MNKQKKELDSLTAKILAQLPPKQRAQYTRLAAAIPELPTGSMKRATTYAEKQLKPLKRKSYRELSALPARTELKAPAQLPGFRFFTLRKRSRNGELEIGVEASYWEQGTMRLASTPHFVMRPDGTLRETFVHDPED